MQKRAFTLAEVLITLGVIGVVAALTIPILSKKSAENQYVSGLLEFNSLINQAVLSWRQEVGCNEDMILCIGSNLSAQSDLDNIAKYLKVTQKACDTGCDYTQATAPWLPAQTYMYNGDPQNTCNFGCYSGGNSKQSDSMRQYLLSNGMVMGLILETAPKVVQVNVDVNGVKPPNRFGKDTFAFHMGGSDTVANSDKMNVHLYPRDWSNGPYEGLCGPYSKKCDPNSTDPTNNSASPTAYVILNHKLPDFDALSQSISGFKP